MDEDDAKTFGWKIQRSYDSFNLLCSRQRGRKTPKKRQILPVEERTLPDVPLLAISSQKIRTIAHETTYNVKNFGTLATINANRQLHLLVG